MKYQKNKKNSQIILTKKKVDDNINIVTAINVMMNLNFNISGDQLSWLEHLPYKQGVIGSSPISPTINAEMAQLVAQLICNQWVPGSSPGFGTIFFGEVAKWLNAADCKSVPSGSMVRIHLSPPLIASQPSGKASDFDSDMRQFESSQGSHYYLSCQLSRQSI